MVRGDLDECDESKTNLLYLVSKKAMPNIFQGTCFKKNVSQILEERSARDFLL